MVIVMICREAAVSQYSYAQSLVHNCTCVCTHPQMQSMHSRHHGFSLQADDPDMSHLQGFGVGTAAVGMTISTYALARLMMNLPAGILADRHGRKLLLVWGPAITALGEPTNPLASPLPSPLLAFSRPCPAALAMQVAAGLGPCNHCPG